MPLPGGPANKLGNRYEELWTEYQLLRLLDSESESVRLEEPGVDKAEFVVRRGIHTEFHQAKRAGIRGQWSIASLKSEGVLQSLNELLTDPNASFVFVSGCAAQELSEICDDARNAESEQEFATMFLKAKKRRNLFQRICEEWQCGSKKAINHLRRIQVKTISERELEEKVTLYVRNLFLADATGVLAELTKLIGDSVHKTIRRIDLRDLMQKRGFLLRRITSRDQAVGAIKRVTDGYLEVGRRKLIHQTLVSRQASQQVFKDVQNSATVLVGKAGSGKSACAVEIVECLLTKRLEVLAFRLDHYVSASNTGVLGERLGLEESPVHMLAAAAEKSDTTGVLIVDQLDAVSTMSGRSSDALDLVENLLGEAEVLRERVKIHVVVVCRSFDWNNDHRLRGLIQECDTKVEVGEFTNEETLQLLQTGGFAPSLFSGTQLRLLRVPQNLSLFLDVGFATDRTPNFKTVTQLFDKYWDVKQNLVAERVSHSTNHWQETLRLLCEEMAAMQELSVRKEVLDAIPPQYLNQMASERVLAFDSNRYGFGHESFFDYCYARVSFLPGSESLTSMLCSSEQHLFRRGQVRQVLTYIRDADFDRYMKEIWDLLCDARIRVHIKDLVFALLADVMDPTEEEWQIWHEWTRPALLANEAGSSSSEPLSNLAWRRLFGSRPWFHFLVCHGVVAEWLESGNDRLIDLITGQYFRLHQTDAPDLVAKLLEPYVGSDGNWRSRLEIFATWADASGSRRLFELFLRLIKDGTLDGAKGPIAVNSTFWSMFHALDESRPEWVGELLAHRLKRCIAIRVEDEQESAHHQLLGPDNGVAEMFIKAAEAAPLEFVQHVLPVVLEASELTAKGDAPRRDEVWSYLIRTAHPNADETCLEALAIALGKLTDVASVEQRDAFLNELRGRDTYVANYLLLAFCRGDPARLGAEMVARFCTEPWRFNCGFLDNENWCAIEAIKAISPQLLRHDLSLLEEAILNYVPKTEASFEGRRSRGSSQFALLSAIPLELRSEKTQTRFQELERKFGEVPGEPEIFEARIVESPISSANSEKMTDEQWLNAMRRYSTESSFDLGRDGEFVGGAHELSQVLQEGVENEPERFARLAMSFDASMNPAYMQRLLIGLSHVELDETLKLDVCRKAFSESREDCGCEIADAVGSYLGLLPIDAVEILDWLATEHPDPERELWQQQTASGGKYFGGEMYTYGFNTVRGRAAIGISRLILSDYRNLVSFRGTLERMVNDPSSAVLSCVANVVEAVAATDPEEALALFLTMDLPTEELLITPPLVRFLRYSQANSFTELRPLIERMICGSNRDVAKEGAILAGLALLHGHEADSLVDLALLGGEAQRLGIAHVASSNIGNRDSRDWCERRLTDLFEDDAAEVRQQAASCFGYLKGVPLEEYSDLVDRFSESTAFGDDSSTILRTLEESRQRLPGMTCLVCERHIRRFADEARGIQNRRGMDLFTLVKLVFRTYQQHQEDVWATRTLNVIDQLCLEGLSGIGEGFEAFER